MEANLPCPVVLMHGDCGDLLDIEDGLAASPVGLAGDEGTFSLCTFWYVDALARTGRL